MRTLAPNGERTWALPQDKHDCRSALDWSETKPACAGSPSALFSAGRHASRDWRSRVSLSRHFPKSRFSLRQVPDLSKRRVRSIGHAFGFESREIDDEGFRLPLDGVRRLEKRNDRDDTSAVTHNLG